MPLFKVGSVLDLSFYQELENSFFCYDDLDFFLIRYNLQNSFK